MRGPYDNPPEPCVNCEELEETIAERDAEIERLRVKYGVAVDRFCDENAKVKAHEKREAAYLAFVEFADGELPEMFDLDYDHSDSDWDRWMQARERLREVMDDQ